MFGSMRLNFLSSKIHLFSTHLGEHDVRSESTILGCRSRFEIPLESPCTPSKALLHVAAVMDEVSHMADLCVDFGKPVVNIDKLRGHKEKVTGKLTGGLAAMAKMRKVSVVRGYGAFVGANHVEGEETSGDGKEKTGTKKVIAFKNCIIAAGSQAVRLPFMLNDPRVVDSTGALELKSVPKRMLILGGGIIGLEMGTVYSTLGARLDVVEMMDGLMQGADRELVKIWQKMNAPRFDLHLLKTMTVGARALPEGIEVTFESAEPGENGSNASVAAPAPQVYDLVLQAVGRTPNGKKIAADKAGVAVTDRGFISVDIQMRTNVPHIFAIGDIVGQRMLAHKAVHEAHVAAEVIAGELQGNKELAAAAFNARVIPSVAYTDPEVAWVGLTEDQAKAQGIKVKKGLFPWTASGRAIANGRDEGVTKLLFDDSPEAHGHGHGHGHGKILGCGMVGTHAGDMIGEISLRRQPDRAVLGYGGATRTNQRMCDAIYSLAGALPTVPWFTSTSKPDLRRTSAPLPLVHAPKPDVHRVEICGFERLHIGLHVGRTVPPRAADCASLAPPVVGTVGGPLPHIGPHVVQAVYAGLCSPCGRSARPGIGVTRVGTLRAVARGPRIGSAFLPRRWGRLAQIGKACRLPF